jgi:hypothetical protein
MFFDWGDGTNSGWLAVGTTSASKSWGSANTYQVKAQARCSTDIGVVSSWSGTLWVTITGSGGETVSQPSTPSGLSNGQTPCYGYYTTGGSTSSLGHSVQYLFDWGDRTNSGWLAVGQMGSLKYWWVAGTYTVRAKARCAIDTSVESNWSLGLLITITDPETVSTPTVPSGPTSGSTGTNYSYSTGGSTSNLGHAVEYQFDWKGDGTDLSGWGSYSQSKTWTTSGTYSVKARARCAINTTVTSSWSSGLSVTITDPETVSTPAVPSGPTSGSTGTNYSYSTGGSTSNLGHNVEYQFDWKGDETDLSPWGSSTQSKTWSTSGAYSVRARARCATHTSVVSGWSSGLLVTITMDCQGQHVKIENTLYETLELAYNAAVTGDTIKCQGVRFTENLTVNRNIEVTLAGGYDCVYAPNVGSITFIHGMVTTTVGGGKITIKNFFLEK